MKIKEIRDFMLYLEGPLLSKGRYRKETVILIKALSKYAPEFDNARISKENIYQIVFGDEELKDGKLEKVMFELYKCLRLFLLSERYLRAENEQTLQIDFATILSERGLHQKASNQIKLVLDEINTQNLHNASDYERLFQAAELSYTMKAQKNRWKDDLNIAETLRYLDYHYFSKRLGLLNHYLLILKISRLDTDIDLEKEQKISQLFKLEAVESPSVFIAKKIFDLYSTSEPNVANFEELFQLLTQYEPDDLNEEIRTFFGYLRNYCSILIINGYRELWPILHRINMDNLQKQYFYYNDQLSTGAYFNISNAAIKANDTKWAAQFIESHKNRVVGDNETQDFYRTTLANLYFHQGAFEETLDILPPASQHLDFHLTGRRLELKAYYCLKSDLLLSKIDAFKMYVSRAAKKNLSEEMSEMNSNFVNFLHQIVYSKPGDPNRGATIIKRIQEKKLLYERDWLIEKAGELG